jgi:hypothetical protein
MDLYLELCLGLDLKPFPPVLHCTTRYPRPQPVKLLLPQIMCHDSDDAGLNQYSAGPHGRGQSSNFQFDLVHCCKTSSTSIIKEIKHMNLLLQLDSSRSTLLVFRHLGLITSCPRWVLVIHEKIGYYNKTSGIIKVIQFLQNLHI